MGTNIIDIGNNYRNSIITGILRDIFWNSPTLHPKCEAAPEVPIRTDRCLSMLGKLAENAIDNNSGFC